MSDVVESMLGEYRRYKVMGEAAMNQLSDEQLHQVPPGGGNSISSVAWHIAGNFNSRFTDFLTADGEKPWRDRESEFARRTPTRSELMAYWEGGWKTLCDSLEQLTDDHLSQNVKIRGADLRVLDALHRSLAHASYHVGQIIYAGKTMKGADWKYLTIPPGMSEAYNKRATGEKPYGHINHLKSESNW
jgi:uncharacterized damage-inducible protein DinB